MVPSPVSDYAHLIRAVHVVNVRLNHLLTSKKVSPSANQPADPRLDAPLPRWSRLDQLAQQFGLSEQDVCLLMLALAPTVSHMSEQLIQRLQGAQGPLTTGLATYLWAPKPTENAAIRARLTPTSPLIEHQLLLFSASAESTTEPTTPIYVAPTVAHWLAHHCNATRGPGIAWRDTRQDPGIPKSNQHQLLQLAGLLRSTCTLAIVGGLPGTREGIAQAVARQVNLPLVRIDLSLATSYLANPSSLVRDLRLDGAMPLLTGMPGTDASPEVRTQLKALAEALYRFDHPVCLDGHDEQAVALFMGGERPQSTIKVAKPPIQERIQNWTDRLVARNWDPKPAGTLAGRFAVLSGPAIDRVLDRAWAEAGAKQPTINHLQIACREAVRPDLPGLARRVTPQVSWKDLIVAEPIRQRLLSIYKMASQTEKVIQGWGAPARRGRGIKVLLSGNPGTGKTMAAEVLAHGLGVELFVVDLSMVVSKWVGETQKFLRDIFDAAEGGAAVLLFDEGDALFGQRGSSQGAQDRYANQEVSYLLQRMETFDGVLIVTTNLRENLDDAFARRFSTSVEFAMPTESERLRLWKQAIPPQAPKSQDLKLEGLAKQFYLAGGAISNAAYFACIQAASEGKPVSLYHCLHGVIEELLKLDKQINRVTLGPYYEQLFGE